MHIHKLSFAALLLLTACKVGPNHYLPPMQMETKWHADDERDSQQKELLSHSNPLALGELFDDPLLQHYLQLIACNNHDAKIAAVKVQEAFALRRISAAKLLPVIDGRINYSRSDPAGGALTPNTGSTTTPAAAASTGGVFGQLPLNLLQQTFIADFDALWEIDLFGRNRREVESATAFIHSEQASYDWLLISLTAEFARHYLELRRSQNHLELAQRKIALLEQRKGVAKKRQHHGLNADTEWLSTDVLIAAAAAEIPLDRAEILASMYHLSFLLGYPPDRLVADLEEIKIPLIKETIPIGFPSDLLRRRPDIRIAEQQLAQATANVGVAVAELFPKLTLMGNYGFESLHLGNTKGKGESWGYGGSLLGPIFHGGSLRANLAKNMWIRDENFIGYQQAVLRALEESESAIARFLKSAQSLHYTKNIFSGQQKLLVHSEERYKSGLDNRLQLLEYQLALIDAERQWIDAEINHQLYLIALYKALGGGFKELKGGCDGLTSCITN